MCLQTEKKRKSFVNEIKKKTLLSNENNFFVFEGEIRILLVFKV